MKPQLKEIDNSQVRSDLPEFNIGDTIRVFTKIVEGGNERVQRFAGTVISRKGTGSTETITLRRVLYGEGVEKVILINSPLIQKIEIERQGHARRTKLYYLRDLVGKKARVKEKKRTVN